MTDPAFSPKRYLVDTNVLVAISLGNDDVNDRMTELERAPSRFFVGLQNLCEFWNVSTRPAANNAVLRELMVLLRAHRVSGRQIHDARLAALILAYSLDGVVTFNTRDFVRYAGTNPIGPTAATP